MSEGLVAPQDRGMSAGQILERVFYLCRSEFKTLVAIAAVPAVTFFLTLGITLGGLMVPFFGRMPKDMSEAQNHQVGMLFVACMTVVMLTCSAAFAPSFAAGSYAAVHADLGRRVRFREAYAFALQRFWRYLGLLLATLLIGMGPVFVFELLALIPAISLEHHSGEPKSTFFVLIPLAIIGFLGVYVLSIILMLRLSFAFPGCVTESLTVVGAIKRSNQLTRGAKGKTFLVLLVVYAICYAGYLIGMVIAAIWFALLGLISLTLGNHVPHALVVIVGIMTAVGVLGMMMFFMAWNSAGFSVALSVIYNDQRRVIDGPPHEREEARAQG